MDGETPLNTEPSAAVEPPAEEAAPTASPAPEAAARPSALRRFLRAPIELRSYANLLFLALAFPTGLGYFIFLSVGLSLGLGLAIVWIGLPILALVLAVSFGLAAVERQLAIRLLGAQVPPMLPAPAPAETGVWRRVRAFLSNPVTWKGMGYLAIKLPLGLASFVALVVSLAVAGSLLATPFAYPWVPIYILDRPVDSFGLALALAGAGAALALVSLNLLNLLAAGWRELARTLLGSRRFAAAPAR